MGSNDARNQRLRRNKADAHRDKDWTQSEETIPENEILGRGADFSGRVRAFLRTTDRMCGAPTSPRQKGGGVRVWIASAAEKRAQKRDDLVFILAEIAPQLRKRKEASAGEVANYLDLIRLEIQDQLEGGE